MCMCVALVLFLAVFLARIFWMERCVTYMRRVRYEKWLSVGSRRCSVLILLESQATRDELLTSFEAEGFCEWNGRHKTGWPTFSFHSFRHLFFSQITLSLLVFDRTFIQHEFETFSSLGFSGREPFYSVTSSRSYSFSPIKWILLLDYDGCCTSSYWLDQDRSDYWENMKDCEEKAFVMRSVCSLFSLFQCIILMQFFLLFAWEEKIVAHLSSSLSLL